MKAAFLDLGTNTFHLLIAEKTAEEAPKILYRESQFVYLGQGGISKNEIAPEAAERALKTLKHYRQKIDEFGVTEVRGTATSALRSAKNGQEILQRIATEANLRPKIISGHEEAELIFRGIKSALKTDPGRALVMDIGGGSVEFILFEGEEVLYLESFDLGAQRLMDRFHTTDPIPAASVAELEQFLAEQLAPLLQQLKQHPITTLLGSSGTFSTLREMHIARSKSDYSVDYLLPHPYLQEVRQQLLNLNRSERLALAGMAEKRVDMIVTASVLLHFVLQQAQPQQVRAVAGALREGLMESYFEGSLAF